MSFLGTVTADDLKSGVGAPLPPRAYRATVETAEAVDVGGGRQLKIMMGNLRTKEGATEFQNNGGTYRIGNRKLFDRAWVRHNNPQAASIGRQNIIKLLVSAGIIPNEPGVEDPFDSEEDLINGIVGKEVTVFTKQKTRDKPGPDGEPVVDAEVAAYLPA
jgi:hypothetical protein